MAQALFDEHPLEEYLREAGESPMLIPGISPELEQEIDPYYGLYDDDMSDECQLDWCPLILLEFLEVLQSAVSSVQSQSPSNSFIERFKYSVISSSLLAPSLSTPHPGRTHRSLPGKLQHSRASSMDLDRPASPSPIPPSDPSYGPISFAAVLAAVFFSIGFPFFPLILMMATLFLLYNFISMTETSKHDMTSSLNALDDLVAANDMWDSIVQDAVTFLDNEERNSSGPPSPSTIRIALHSCLQTTHTQCDNVRHLFSALTSPTELSQLSEMYAPPSPIKPGFSAEIGSRPFSLSSPRLQSSPIYSPTTPESKRSTWNGPYAGLAYAGSPTNPVFRRRHRVNLSEFFQAGVNSAPTTPFISALTPSLPERSMTEELVSSSTDNFSPLPSHFGAAALDLQRKRKSGGMEAFRTPPANYFTSDLRTPRSARNSMFVSSASSSSKFTNVQSSRHPLSYSSLNHSLQGALAAKRYACSHLLALRFGDEEDEGYWEDVRSVMGLLSSALSDGFSRLSEALDEMEQQNLRDQNPTPIATPQSDIFDHDVDTPELLGSDQDNTFRRRKSGGKVSFAPMPNHISRFAAHIDAISSALDDARDNLEQCVAALKADPTSSSSSTPSKTLRHSRSFSRTLSPAQDNDAEAEEIEAVQAYERLRRELGLALRECERGRERLMEIINPPPIPSEDEEEFDDVPGLGHDASDDSDKADPTPPSEDETDTVALANAGRFRTAVLNAEGGEGEGTLIDDATSHLLLTTSTQHLPMPGIEEVFEADTGPKVVFSREKSKLSREERIKISKARRESGLGLNIGVGAPTEGEPGPAKMGMEKWGPGGEVVQELKDVIWKVSERKRKLADSGADLQVASETSPSSSLESS
ncbi:hypothetical protein BDZ97DRAFT_2070616 [Flammula alnicola]|nr:hypothetical protein BDZ97DRAFT_2070616 [Flammula alnicola]